MVQKACSGVEDPEEEGEEGLAKEGTGVDFAYELQTFKFRTPTVRFSYDVSPPPPPPLEIEAYQNLVDDDAEGFIEVRRRLDSWFPKLQHIATSANGAKIGPHLPDFVVTPQVRNVSHFQTSFQNLQTFHA